MTVPGGIASLAPGGDDDVARAIRDLQRQIQELRTAIPKGVVSAQSLSDTLVFDATDTSLRTLMSLDMTTPDGFGTAYALVVATMWSMDRDATTTGDNRLTLQAFAGEFINGVDQQFPEPSTRATMSTTTSYQINDLSSGDVVTIGAKGFAGDGWAGLGQISVSSMVLFIR